MKLPALAVTIMLVLSLSIGASAFTWADNPGNPTITNTQADPIKVYPGQSLKISVSFTDEYGIGSAMAEFHHEKGSDFVPMILSAGSRTDGTYTATWIVHDTRNLEWYKTTVMLANTQGGVSTADVPWQDPTVSHELSELNPGLSQDAGSTGYQFYTSSTTAGDYAVAGNATGASGLTYGVYGESNISTGGTGVYGLGRYKGVVGKSEATGGSAYGVYGESISTSGTGVLGIAQAYTGYSTGVSGTTNSPQGRGVLGMANVVGGTPSAVYGILGSQNYGYAIRGEVSMPSLRGYSGMFTGGLGVNINGSMSFYDDLLQMETSQHIPRNGTRKTIFIPTVNYGVYNAITIDGRGHPVIVFHDDTFDDLRVIICYDRECSGYYGALYLDSTGDVGKFASATTGTDGYLVAAYRDATNDALKVIKCNDAWCTQSLNNITTVYTGTNVATAGTSITINQLGFPIIAFNEGSDLMVAVCTNANCSTSLIRNPRPGGRNPSIVIGGNGLPFIIHGTDPDEVAITVCSNWDCSSDNSQLIHNDAGRYYRYFAAAVSRIGTPIMAYQDSNNNDLYYTYCQDYDCSTKTQMFLDGSGGKDASIISPTDGSVVIAHYDSVPSALQVHVCFDYTCAVDGSNTLDTLGTAGEYSSIIRGDDGNPIIAYHTTYVNQLGIYKCLNPYCIPFFTRR